MVNSYHQKTFVILRSNVMSKLNVKILQYKQNIWKGKFKYSIEQVIFKKWRRLLTIFRLEKIQIILIDNDNKVDDNANESSSTMKRSRKF